LAELGFHKFVSKIYDEVNIHDWGMLRLKEKLKALKKEISRWNKEFFLLFGTSLQSTSGQDCLFGYKEL